MELILDAPMIADSLCKAFRVVGQAGDKISGFLGDFLTNVAFRLNHTDEVEIFPLLFFFQPIDIGDRVIMTTEKSPTLTAENSPTLVKVFYWVLGRDRCRGRGETEGARRATVVSPLPRETQQYRLFSS